MGRDVTVGTRMATSHGATSHGAGSHGAGAVGPAAWRRRALIAVVAFGVAAGWGPQPLHAQADTPAGGAESDVLDELWLTPMPLMEPALGELPFVPPLPSRRPSISQTADDTLRRPNTPPAAPGLVTPPPTPPPRMLTRRPPQPPTVATLPEPQRPADDTPLVASDAQAPTGQTVFTLPDNEGFRVLFAEQSDRLSDAAGRLLTGVAERMLNDSAIRLQIKAYASGTPETASRARRLSLNRALTIRTFLIDRGVRGTRIDVRALGNTAPDMPQDRVDLLLSS